MEKESLKENRLRLFFSESEKIRLKDQAEGQRHLTARRALLRCLWEGKEPAALWFFEAWLKNSGAKSLIDDIQRLAAKPTKTADDSRNLKIKTEEINNYLGRVGPSLQKAIYVFVRDTLKLPWPWVAEDLLRIFLSVAAGAVISSDGEVNVIMRMFIAHNGKETPPRQDGENLTAYAKRLVKHSRRLAGRSPKGGGKHIDVWVEWFYLHRVLKKSKRQIARTEMKNYSDAERQVKYGIDQVEKLLSLSPYRFNAADWTSAG